MNIFYNPKYKTKQIFDLSVAPVGDPEPGEVFYWISYENSKLYANYKIYGVAQTKTYEITDPQSFNPSAVFENKVKSIEWDDENFAIEYADENLSHTVPVTGLLKSASLSNNVLTFEKCGANEQDITIDLSAMGKHVASVSVNASSKQMTFTYSDGQSFNVNLSSLLAYTGGSTGTANVSVAANNEITASVKVSGKTGNQILLENDGLFVPAASDIDLSAYATKSELNGKVDAVAGKGLSTNDFTNSLKSKLESISVSGTVFNTIKFTNSTSDASMYWSGNIGHFTHTLNCIPSVKIYDNNFQEVMVEIIPTSSTHFTADFQNKSSVQGEWTCIVNYGAEWPSA